MVKVKGQGQIFQKMGKNQRTGHISEAISPTDFILGTKVQPNKAHSMTQVPMTKVQPNKAHSMTQESMTLSQGQPGQGQAEIFPKMGKKTKNWSYLGGYFSYRLHTW